jgi:hypothetical protein
VGDRIRFSLWFESQPTAQILPRLAHAAEVLPIEALERGVWEFRVVALNWSEPALVDQRISEGITVAQALEEMRGFVHEDCACELEMAWMLWGYGEAGWKQSPHPVRIASLGPRFGERPGEEGHVVVDFGLDEPFLAEAAPWNADTRRYLQANILQLLAYCHKAQQQMRPRLRRLWTDETEDWTEKLVRRLREASAEEQEVRGEA